MSNPKEHSTIEFIDPNELITFVAEGSGDFIEPTNTKQPKASKPDPSSLMSEEEFEAEEDLFDFEDQWYSKELDENVILKKRENTRGTLAIMYTLFTFLIFIIVIVVAVIDGTNRKVSIIDNLSDILPLISGIFLGSLGFVLGYYFKREDD